MNRLSPLIARRSDAVAMARSVPPAMNWQSTSWDGAEPAKSLEELKLFATGWVGGLIFFGTYLS